MKEKELAIIGCGATGLASAAWFKSQGFSVTLCDTKEQFAELSELEKQGTICLEGALNLTEPIQIDEITTDISRAILDKQYILVCCSATRQTVSYTHLQPGSRHPLGSPDTGSGHPPVRRPDPR